MEFRRKRENNEEKEKMRSQTRENINLVSLIAGIILILIGLAGSAITIPTKNPIIIAPIILLLIGAILSLMGGLRKWG